VYQRKQPPYRAANRALLSVDELALVEGFDAELVEALRPSVTVFPWARGGGINPNTAPPWVLALLFHGIAGDYRLASAQVVEDVVKQREAGRLLCDETADDPACTKLSESVPGEVFPPPSFTSDVLEVEATARVGDVRRTVEAAIDRSDPQAPLILSWRVR
jgi:type II secretory pathway component PulK